MCLCFVLCFKLRLNEQRRELAGFLLGGTCVKHLLAALHARHGFHILPPVTHFHRLLLYSDRNVLIRCLKCFNLMFSDVYLFSELEQKHSWDIYCLQA